MWLPNSGDLERSSKHEGGQIPQIWKSHHASGSTFFLVPCCECQFLFTIHHATFLRFIKAGNYAPLADKSFSRISFKNKCGERKKSCSVTGIISLTTSFSLRIYLRPEVPDAYSSQPISRSIPAHPLFLRFLFRHGTSVSSSHDAMCVCRAVASGRRSCYCSVFFLNCHTLSNIHHL